MTADPDHTALRRTSVPSLSTALSGRARRSVAALLAASLLGLVAACGGGGGGADGGAATGMAPAALRTTALSVDATGTTDGAAVGTADAGAASGTAHMTANAATAGWTTCAAENQTCAFTGSRQVRYGAAGAYAVLTLAGGTRCANAVFGDPLPGVVKACELADAATAAPTPAPTPFDPSLWTACASEGGACVYSGTRSVRYGTTTSAVLLALSGPATCSNAVFGDPAYGVAKSCWVANDTAVVVPSPGFAACANEGGRCAFAGTRVVRYGTATALVSGTYTDGVACTNAVFGDPAYGVAKACSVAADTTAAPVAGGGVVASLSMPALTAATMGVPLQIVARALDAGGAAIADATLAWGVADTGIATVDATGRVVPVRSGVTKVTATSGGQQVSGVLSVRGPTPIPTRSKYVGTNLGGVAYYGSNFPFADLMKSGGGWSVYNDNGSSRPFPSVAATGYPTALAAGQHARAAVAWGNSFYAQGQYTVLWDGQGSVSFPLSSVRVVQSAANRIVLQTTGDLGSALWVSIDSTNPADPVRNVRFLWPGTEATYATQPFNPEFLKRAAPYSALRFMDWGQTNGSPVAEWSDRSHLDDATWATGRGVPLEAMIELANSLHVDPWFCIPHLASDDYVAKFAQLLHDRLDPTLKPHVEYSNEVWNYGFPQTIWAMAQSDKLGLDRPWGTPSLFYAQRATQMFKVMRQVWGTVDAPRLVRVIAGQAAWTQFLENALAYADTAANADVMAIAPYFQAPAADDTANFAATSKLSGSQIVDQMLGHIRGDIKGWMTGNAALAARYRLPMKAYESGPGDSLSYFPAAQQATLTALFTAANADPHIADAYAEYYAQWKAVGGDTVMQYHDIGGWSVYGFWGALQSVMQDVATSPKYQALMKVIAGNPTAAAATAVESAVATSSALVP